MADKPRPRKSRSQPLELEALRTIHEHRMLDPGDRVLVAVSGGADSVALLHCLFRLAPRLHISLAVAHLNHGLRGEESEGDANYVRDLCAGLGLDLISETIALKEILPASGMNLEQAARDARYAFLRKAATQAGCARIAVAHTKNDQAETVLFRFLRGSGVTGLAAILPVREGTIIRPLIRSARLTVESYLESLGVSWRKDSSNCDLRFRRNRLRLEWIPALEKDFNPRLVDTIAREADLAREAAEFLDSVVKSEFERLSLDSGTAIRIPELLALPPALHTPVLREALKRRCGSLRGISSEHLFQIIRLCRKGQSGRRVELPDGVVVAREFETLRFTRTRDESIHRFRYDLPIPGRCVIPEAGIIVTASLSDPSDSPDRGRRVHLDPSSLPGPLVVRSRLPGDRYGGPGHRKVKKMLIDARITADVRGRLPLLAVEGAVVWIPGFEPAKPFRPQVISEQHVVVEIEPITGGEPAEKPARMET